jgi:PAS domain S-box-containing protein
MNRTMPSRLRLQHRLVAEFSVAALRTESFDSVIRAACRVAAEGLSVSLAKAMRFEDGALYFVAAVGWDENDREHIVFAVDDSNPAGFAFLSRRPVVSNHLAAEQQFRTPSLFARYGITRAINIPIRGIPDYYGVLEADGQGGEDFVETDTVFLEAIADVVALTRERLELVGEGPSDAYLSSIQSSTADCVVVTTSDGRIEYLNERSLAELRTDTKGELTGASLENLFADEYRDLVRDAFALALGGKPTRVEAASRADPGPMRWWDISFTRISRTRNVADSVACAMRDVTARHEHEEELAKLIASQEALIDSSSLIVNEVHHRVRNSLQLVQNLLGMQATVSQDAAVKDQLRTAAARVRTIAAVHEKLYQTESGNQPDARRFIEELLGELQGLAPGREVYARIASGVVVAGSRLSALGMVIAELVTNSLKYGAGKVTVDLAISGGDLLVTVSDEGAGFSLDFPAAQGTGLGMRLIRTYSGHGPDAILVDRNVSFGRISVRFRQA